MLEINLTQQYLVDRQLQHLLRQERQLVTQPRPVAISPTALE